MLKRYKQRNMYIDTESDSRGLHDVYSYDTWIGCIDYAESLFLTWGYCQYSATTSCQITKLCREKSLRRVDINKSEIYIYKSGIKEYE